MNGHSTASKSCPLAGGDEGAIHTGMPPTLTLAGSSGPAAPDSMTRRPSTNCGLHLPHGAVQMCYVGPQ
jgi:hypothetical protein